MPSLVPGIRVVWLERAPLSQKRSGVLVYDGPPCDGIPTYDVKHWSSLEEYEAVQQGNGRIRFTSVFQGLIVRVDRSHPETGQSLVPWYYAPDRARTWPETKENRIEPEGR
jgi:hypothetical protein